MAVAIKPHTPGVRSAAARPLWSRRSPCILVLTDDYENMIEVRVRIPFDGMFKAGLISGYHIYHRGRLTRSVGIPADIAEIDAVWVQRILVNSLAFVADALDGEYVYDIDDHLLVAPAYQSRSSDTTKEIVRTLLRGAKVVSSTSLRLFENLKRRSRLPLSADVVITPNMAEWISVLPGSEPPSTLLVAASGRLPLTVSHDAFIRGVTRFLERRRLPVLYIGPPLPDRQLFGTNVRATGVLDYFTYREIIRRANAMAIVPLESRGDPDTQEFVTSKSDVKMVEFGSCGVPALYSDVAPYQDTALQCGPLADMGDDRAVDDGLEQVLRNADQIKVHAEKSVREHRLAHASAAADWFAAIEAGLLARPLPLSELLERVAGYAALAPTAEAQLAVLHQRGRIPIIPTKPDPSPAEVWSSPGRPAAPSALRAAVKRIRGKGPARTTVPTLFDSEFYLLTYPDARTSGLDPYRHYLQRGVPERRNPNAFFDAAWYVRRYPEAGLPGMDPLQHYLSASADPSVDPSPRFSTRLYRMLNPDLGGMHPLQHYLDRCRSH